MGRPLLAIRHAIREAWEGLWRNPALSLLSAASIGISLYVLGLFLLLAFNLNRFVEALGRETQVQVYLLENVARDTLSDLRAEFATDPAISSVRFVSKEDARLRFQRDFPSLRDLPDRVGSNPFPSSFELEIRDAYRDPDSLDRVAKSYEKAPGVEEVRYDRGWTERLVGIVALVQRGGYGLGVLLALAALVTVGAVVQLTVLARREEIEIMKLVGATAAFIRGPFLLAAAVQGLVGGAIAVAGLFVTHRLVERADVFRSNPFMSLVAGRFLPAEAATMLAAGGAALGILAAILSLRRAGTF
jgi:cell division transport system permease protein